ncbi:MAG: hypothetical protein ABIY56_05985 [Dokdonella sp.]
MARIHTRGLVLRMDPIMLRQQGARCTRDLDTMTSAQHNFVCIEADAKGAWWLPLSAAAQVGSVEIPASAKSGDRRWVDGPAYYLPDQCWYAPHKAAQMAATAAHDRSDAKNANTIAANALPQATEFPDLIGD